MWTWRPVTVISALTFVWIVPARGFCRSAVPALSQYHLSPSSKYCAESAVFCAESESGSTPSVDPKSPSSPSPFRPLYDGTDYTFPDTTTPAGISELLEVSFVKACMQLASGYVDILKMFIAASVAAYENGFPLKRVQDELRECERQTANRPLMPEEEKLRFQWLCIVYMTLSLMQHPTKAAKSAAAASTTERSLTDVPDEIRDDYEELIAQISQAYTSKAPIPSIESLVSQKAASSATLSDMEKAVLSQSLRVATLTPVVLQESAAVRDNSSSGSSIDPPEPPIKGAFEYR